MDTLSKKQTKELQKIIREDYGVFLDYAAAKDLGMKLTRLVLLAKKHALSKDYKNGLLSSPL